MAIINVVGATQMGKSWLVENVLLKRWKKKVVIDPRESFKSSTQRFYGLNIDTTLKAFDKYEHADTFQLALQNERRNISDSLFSYGVSLSSALGRSLKKRGSEEFIAFVVDEAGTVTKSKKGKDDMEFILSQGRHDHVDTILIAQDIYMLETLARRQARETICFFVNGASNIPEYKSVFGNVFSKKIENLPKYHYLTKHDNGLITITNEKGKIYEKFGAK